MYRRPPAALLQDLAAHTAASCLAADPCWQLTETLPRVST